VFGRYVGSPDGWSRRKAVVPDRVRGRQGAFALVYFTRQSIPTIQVFDCRALFLYLLARQVPRAAGGILRFAGQPLGDTVGRQLRISDESAETLDQCAFDLMGDALDAIGVHPDQLIPASAGNVLFVADYPLGGSIGRQLRVADGFA
jgi:hypothetical protein